MKSVGIDIGKFSIKMAEVDATGKAYSIVRFEEFPLNQDPNKDTQLDIIEYLRGLSSQYDANTTHFVIGIEQHLVSCRRLEFPFNDRYKIIKTLPFELEDEIPIKLEVATCDAKISKVVGNSAHVLAVTCPGERVEKILDLAHDGQIDPHIIAPNGVALANLFETWREAPLQEESPEEESVATPGPFPAQIFIDIGHHVTTILIIKDGYLLDTRTIQWGGQDVAQAISSKYNIHYLEALKELRKKAFVLNSNEGATEDQIIFSDLIKSEFDKMGHRLKLILMDLRSQHKLEFKSASLVGGVSQIKNIGLYITQLIEVPTNRLKKIPHHPGIDLEASPKNELVSMTALGLAIDGIKKRKNPAVNLRQGEYSKQSSVFTQLHQKWGHTLKILAAAFVFIFIYGVLKDQIASDLSSAGYDELKNQAKKVANLKGRSASLKKIKSYIKDKKLEEKNGILAEKLAEINSTMDILKKITELTPKGTDVKVDVSNLSIKNENVVIQGTIGNSRQFKRLSQSLKTMAVGKISAKSSPIRSKFGPQKFTFKFRVNRKSKGL